VFRPYQVLANRLRQKSRGAERRPQNKEEDISLKTVSPARRAVEQEKGKSTGSGQKFSQQRRTGGRSENQPLAEIRGRGAGISLYSASAAAAREEEGGDPRVRPARPWQAAVAWLLCSAFLFRRRCEHLSMILQRPPAGLGSASGRVQESPSHSLWLVLERSAARHLGVGEGARRERKAGGDWREGGTERRPVAVASCSLARSLSFVSSLSCSGWGVGLGGSNRPAQS
jgi:hypothetical protein